MNAFSRLAVLSTILLAAVGPAAAQDATGAKELVKRIGVNRGLCVVLGDTQGEITLSLARASELTFYIQSPSAEAAARVRRAADAAGMLGTRVYVDHGKGGRIHLAENLADAVVVSGTVAAGREEMLRVLRPDGKALLGAKEIVKPQPKGSDDWSHPYHGPDNNPQSRDQQARGPFLTHFMAAPWYASMPQMTVVSGGRMFKAFGNRTSARPQWEVLNTLLAMNAYNGTQLWRRKLSPGFMIHRNTLIATPKTVYLADDQSCNLLDAATGKVTGEIVAPADLVDGPVWKWMALSDGVLYALIGEKEPKVQNQLGRRFRGAGWPWWKIEKYNFGFGRTILAIDPATKKVLWNYRDEQPLDSRTLCMSGGKIFVYSDQRFLAALDAKTGKEVWKTTDEKLLAAIGAHDPAQHWMKGFASTAYVKCSQKGLYFAGPTRKNIVAVSAENGKLLWQRAGGNSQLVLREEGVYALGEGTRNGKKSSFKLHPISGEVLGTFPSRDRCTRATGCVDAIFTRGGRGGSTAVFELKSNVPKMSQISPMRPACQDGVVVSNGQFYWGPWMCRCDHTQVGVISLGPGGDFDYGMKATEKERLQVAAADLKQVKPLPTAAADWPAYRRDTGCTSNSTKAVPTAKSLHWTATTQKGNVPTAPVAAGGLVFVSGSDGAVRALEEATGKPRWTVYTGGAVKYPPTIADGRAYVGSGDGWIYCLEAATGRLLWRFRGAPIERKVPIFGTLISTWPVGSGVLVAGGVAYAAAGNANYDGTHVYALDAVTGKIRWQNNRSGHLHEETEDSGMGVQSHLLLHNRAVYMAGGSLVQLGSYDVADGRFRRQGAGQGKDLFVHGGQVRSSGYLLYARQDDLHYIDAVGLPAPGQGRHIGLAQKGRSGPYEIALAEQRGDAKARSLWIAQPYQEMVGLAVAPNAVVVAGVDRREVPIKAQGGSELPDKIESSHGLSVLNMADGKVLWKHPLKAGAVSWGVAIDRNGQVLVSLRDGRVLCFAGKN